MRMTALRPTAGYGMPGCTVPAAASSSAVRSSNAACAGLGLAVGGKV